jgi:hypothetical protein
MWETSTSTPIAPPISVRSDGISACMSQTQIRARTGSNVPMSAAMLLKPMRSARSVRWPSRVCGGYRRTLQGATNAAYGPSEAGVCDLRTSNGIPPVEATAKTALLRDHANNAMRMPVHDYPYTIAGKIIVGERVNLGL